MKIKNNSRLKYTKKEIEYKKIIKELKLSNWKYTFYDFIV